MHLRLCFNSHSNIKQSNRKQLTAEVLAALEKIHAPLKIVRSSGLDGTGVSLVWHEGRLRRCRMPAGDLETDIEVARQA